MTESDLTNAVRSIARAVSADRTTKEVSALYFEVLVPLLMCVPGKDQFQMNVDALHHELDLVTGSRAWLSAYFNEEE